MDGQNIYANYFWAKTDPTGMNAEPVSNNPFTILPTPKNEVCCCKDTTKYRVIGYGCLIIPWSWYTVTNCTVVSGKACKTPARPSTWKEKCDTNAPCGGTFAPPLTTPPGMPGPSTSCNYPINGRVCDSTLCWEKQCVCQCAGNSPGMNCVRGCLQCATDAGAPVTPWTEQGNRTLVC